MKDVQPINSKNRAASNNRGKTRQKLLDAGLVLFANHGFDGIAVRDLEEAAGLKPGSGGFYRHFSSKEELLKELMEREFDRAQVGRQFEHEVLQAATNDVREGLRQEFRLVLLGLNVKKDLINLLGREFGHFPELMAEVRDELVDKPRKNIAQIYAKRIDSGELVQVDPVHMTSVVHSALSGYHMAKTFFGEPPDGVDEESFIEALITLVVKD